MSIKMYASSEADVAGIISGALDSIALKLYREDPKDDAERVARGYQVQPVFMITHNDFSAGRALFLQGRFLKADASGEPELTATVGFPCETDTLEDMGEEAGEVVFSRARFLSVCVAAMVETQEKYFGWRVYGLSPDSADHSSVFLSLLPGRQVCLPVVAVPVGEEFFQQVQESYSLEPRRVSDGPAEIGPLAVRYGNMFMSGNFDQALVDCKRELLEDAHLTLYSVELIEHCLRDLIAVTAGQWTWADLVSGFQTRKAMEEFERAQPKAKAKPATRKKTPAKSAKRPVTKVSKK